MEFVYYNANPLQKHVRDCVYRAMSYFFDELWRVVVIKVVRNAMLSGNVNFNYTTNIVDFMRNQGYKRLKVPRKGMTVEEFGEQHAKPNEVYLIHTVKPQHLTIIDGGVLFDTWDCSYCAMDYYFKKEREVTDENV